MSDDLTTATRGHTMAWPLGLAGVALVIIGSFLSWSYDGGILGDLSINFYPGSLQILAIIMALLGLVLLLVEKGPLRKPLGQWLDATLGLRALGIVLTLYMVLVLIAISVESDGLINVNPGGYISTVGAILLLVSSRMLPLRQLRDLSQARLPGWAEILAITLMMAAVLFGAAYALGLTDAWAFVLCLVFITAVIAVLFRIGVMRWFGHVAQRHRKVLTLAAFAVAFFFPFTQKGSDANMSIATQVLIFAATAMGLNIVVGLAGLLDLGYVAFLGSGAYVAAMLSTSAFATIDWHPPFLVVMLLGAGTAATLGLIIGSPTLRVSGDYLAIVTLGFGEIFRLTMFNLDGTNGPLLTNGPNGIPGIPELEIGSFNFGDTHTVAGIELGRFSNYYFLLLLLLGFVILVFSRLNDSRIGRGWVAIREDEKAAEAMGVNVFGLKILAFVVGAFLAGLAGTIKAHQDVAVSPDQFIFLESAFLLAAIVLGGMGTIAGVLLGATILKLLPEKLRFFSEYRLLLFGLLLVLMMRFRPEGLVASRRRQLEFHEEDEELAVAIESELVEEAK
ncbi:branched-chain amino acid transport system permease protein [Kribbella orskensis]|uniref:Branched-chain amino acid transport system permease protein n=1 Tax=Kribbella orskensis TaxID=2512216 RepID=A0ABY2BR84_9ACTN|nr:MULTISPECIES: branched-chain amino acid ABC transporter permease [Kribbella]TCN43237.1 branched-chain amino acid transport system permease protein [Kribbella sp. VKM Ac-2500]TCO29407.1 branched-chain amino acid transport system permease protein [Kribbella orskensis]